MLVIPTVSDGGFWLVVVFPLISFSYVNSYSTTHGRTMQIIVISIKCVIPVDSSSKCDLLIEGTFFIDAVCNMKHSLEVDTEKMRSAKKRNMHKTALKVPSPESFP